MAEKERLVICEFCGEELETEPVPPGETDDARETPDDCPFCMEASDDE